MDQSDFTCDLNCPPPLMKNPMRCCWNCNVRRISHVTEANRHLWTDDMGFGGPGGCKLEHTEKPDECRTYNCQEHVFDVWRTECGRLHFVDGQWCYPAPIGIEEGFGNINTSSFLTSDSTRKGLNAQE
jgi:hypothetical protein